MKRYVKASTGINFNEEYDIRRRADYAETDDPDEIKEVMEDNGYSVASPCTLKSACDMVYSESGDDVGQALRKIEFSSGNSVGVFPLCEYDYDEQQDIYLEYLEKYHPEVDTSNIDAFDLF